MSKHAKPGFRYSKWTLTDANKQYFVAQASLDTFVERLLAKLDSFIAEGGLIDEGVKNVFDAFKWFLTVNSVCIVCGAHHHFNYCLLADILTYRCEHDYRMDGVTVHFDGSVSTGEA
jgi:hypothetical protein